MAATATSNTTATQQPDDASDRLRPFTSDGCSAFPDGTPDQQQLWLSCCQLHDYAYWKGGAYAEREASDLALRRCVAATGQHYIAELMLNGVRIGGTPYLPTSFRWGYGWPFLRGYKPLSPKEIERAKALSQNIHWPSSPQDHHPEKMDQP
ncbi:hypothetical protein G8770_18375 [Aestuariicella hydrocarbonica]|uniref:Uncharacterized protein n=2 Tax=Pseudomaricurvus hydrocarbonicus TaxID=1470433 RepID=A0A9E5T1J7_9GAMM|nr:hypothetical protein [Aestuariicella hydrocarbonica]